MDVAIGITGTGIARDTCGATIDIMTPGITATTAIRTLTIMVAMDRASMAAGTAPPLASISVAVPHDRSQKGSSNLSASIS
jgi:hypothetical protein